MMSMAAIKAFWQIIAAPSYWEKTTHGLSASTGETGTSGQSADNGADGKTSNGDEPTGHSSHPDQTRADQIAHASARVVTLEPPAASSGWEAIAPTLPTMEMTDARWAAPDTANPAALRMARIGRRLQVAGLLAALFVAYAVVVTGLQADHSQSRLRDQLAATRSVSAPAPGHAMARLQAKAAGIDAIVVEGASRGDLHRGPAHVRGTAYPGARGNVVIVGTRVIWSGPFRHLDDLSRGDRIDISTPWGDARYRVVSSVHQSTSQVNLTPSRRAQLTLVTSDGGTGSGRHVVNARLTSHVLRRAPSRTHDFPQLPGSDALGFPLLIAWGLAAVLAWRSRHWLAERWGRVGGIVLVMPLVVFAVYEAFSAVLRILPATF
jgi:LPXTG-site transpeptidase (sortase) family protein